MTDSVNRIQTIQRCYNKILSRYVPTCIELDASYQKLSKGPADVPDEVKEILGLSESNPMADQLYQTIIDHSTGLKEQNEELTDKNGELKTQIETLENQLRSAEGLKNI